MVPCVCSGRTPDGCIPLGGVLASPKDQIMMDPDALQFQLVQLESAVPQTGFTMLQFDNYSPEDLGSEASNNGSTVSKSQNVQELGPYPHGREREVDSKDERKFGFLEI